MKLTPSHSTRMRLFSLLLAVLVTAPVSLPASAGASTAADKRYYLAPADLPPQLLLPPPVEGSPAWKKQATAVEAAQRHAPKADLALMADEQHVSLDMVSQVLGAGFNRDRLPKTFAMFDRVLSDTRAVTEADKAYWHTKRPYLLDERVRLLIDPLDNSPAYPSGHATASRVLAELLGLLYPDKVDALRARADEIAWHRVEAGVHYPNDLEGGRALALLIVGSLLQNEDFHDVFLASQQEIARAANP